MSQVPLNTTGIIPPSFGQAYSIPPAYGASGPNVVYISGVPYIVTQANYGILAQMYINSPESSGDNLVAVTDAFRSAAGLYTSTQNPSTGQNDVLSTYENLEDNDFIKTLNEGREASDSVFAGINNLTQGVLGTAKSVGNITGFLGGILNGFGGVLVFGLIGFYLYRKFK